MTLELRRVLMEASLGGRLSAPKGCGRQKKSPWAGRRPQFGVAFAFTTTC
jgi:hypothetical protein